MILSCALVTGCEHKRTVFEIRHCYSFCILLEVLIFSNSKMYLAKDEISLYNFYLFVVGREQCT
jgi:hypothetical protein